MNALNQALLYGFIDTGYLDGRDPADLTRRLCEGGVDVIQVRAKGWTIDQTRRLTQSVLAAASSHQVPVVINDHPDLAVELGVPWCHLGQEDFFDGGYHHVRDLPASAAGVRFGLSTHAPHQAARALQADPGYIAIGPVFATGTKPTARPVTLDYVRWAAQNVKIPWFAIGGINLENLDAVLEAGARRICVVSAILRSPDITGTCQKFKNRIASASCP